MGRAETICEALEAVVCSSPQFSRMKYITMPRKAEAAILPASSRVGREGRLQKGKRETNAKQAMICL